MLFLPVYKIVEQISVYEVAELYLPTTYNDRYLYEYLDRYYL